MLASLCPVEVKFWCFGPNFLFLITETLTAQKKKNIYNVCLPTYLSDSSDSTCRSDSSDISNKTFFLLEKLSPTLFHPTSCWGKKQSTYDKTQKLKLWRKNLILNLWHTQIVTQQKKQIGKKMNNSNWDKTQIATKLTNSNSNKFKNWNCYNTQKLKLW